MKQPINIVTINDNFEKIFLKIFEWRYDVEVRIFTAFDLVRSAQTLSELF